MSDGKHSTFDEMLELIAKMPDDHPFKTVIEAAQLKAAQDLADSIDFSGLVFSSQAPRKAADRKLTVKDVAESFTKLKDGDNIIRILPSKNPPPYYFITKNSNVPPRLEAESIRLPIKWVSFDTSKPLDLRKKVCGCGARKTYRVADFAPGHADYCDVRKK